MNTTRFKRIVTASATLLALSATCNIAGCPQDAGDNPADPTQTTGNTRQRPGDGSTTGDTSGGSSTNDNSSTGDTTGDGNTNDNASTGDDTGNDNTTGDDDMPLVPPPSGEALRRLVEASTVRTVIAYDEHIPSFVEVNVPAPDTGGDVLLSALGFLEQYRDFYRLEEPSSQFFLQRSVEDDSGAHLFFGQQRDGVIVFGAELAVHQRAGRITGTGGHWLHYIPLFEDPVLMGDSAQIIAAAEIGAAPEDAVGLPTQVIFNAALLGGADDTTRLGWQVAVRNACGTGGDCKLWQFIIDAHTGVVLWRIEPRHECDKDFDIETVNNTESSTCWSRLWETDDDQWFDEDGLDCGFLGLDCPNPSPDGWEAYRSAHAVYDWYSFMFGRCGWDNDDATLEANVHALLRDSAGNVMANATYDSGCDHLKFSTGMVTRDIFAHEYTHAVTRWTSNLTYAFQSGALNESYSDVMAALMTNDWIIGEGCVAGTLRDMTNPSAAPFGDPDHMLASGSPNGVGYQNLPFSNDNGGVHTNSGIPNKVAFLIADGGIHNGFRIRGIGREKTARLYYAVLTTRLTTGSQFIDQRNETIRVAREFRDNNLQYGFTLGDVVSVINAFASVGLGAQDRDSDGFDDNEDSDDDGDHRPDSQDNCPLVQNPYQEDNDGDGIGDPCDTDDDNDGVPDNRDNCPNRFNPDQADRDGDGVGDVCDNCPDYVALYPGRNGRLERYADPDQTDTDRDGTGDLCDADDDNDGVPDVSDNCPKHRNADQVDFDGNGVGLACDGAEQDRFNRPQTPPYLLPWDLCAGGCPDWIGNRFRQRINVLTPYDTNVRIVDQFGQVVAKARRFEDLDGAYSFAFDFRPAASVRYRFPAGVTQNVAGLPSVEGRPVIQATRYYLEVVGMGPNHEPVQVDPASVIVTPMGQ